MKKQRFEILMRYRPFRNWWSRELKRRPCKLIDLTTRKDMVHEKRIFVEKPKIDDLLRFLVACKIPDISIEYSQEDRQFICELMDMSSNLRISQGSILASSAVERALLGFLKAKTLN
jgi:hypothetical protein